MSEMRWASFFFHKQKNPFQGSQGLRLAALRTCTEMLLMVLDIHASELSG